MLKYGLVLAGLGGLGVFSYKSGEMLAEMDVRRAHAEIARLTETNAALEQKNAALRTAAETARLRRAQLQERYEAEVPTGKRRTLLELVDAQLQAGAEAARLRFLIEAANIKEKCEGAPVTKRFLVRTPLYDGPASAGRFADDALVVTASGEPARDGEGRIQAWFDPTRPVALEIAPLGKKPGVVSGTLPLRHAVVMNRSEYRFAITQGKGRGFVEATVDRCRFP